MNVGDVRQSSSHVRAFHSLLFHTTECNTRKSFQVSLYRVETWKLFPHHSHRTRLAHTFGVGGALPCSARTGLLWGRFCAVSMVYVYSTGNWKPSKAEGDGSGETRRPNGEPSVFLHGGVHSWTVPSLHELVRAVASGELFGASADAVMDALAGENARLAFFDAVVAGGGLFGGVEMQEVGALPSWS